jgi:hypothetical protein
MNPVLDPVIAQSIHTRKPVTIRQVFGTGRSTNGALGFHLRLHFVLHVRRWLLFAHSNLGPTIGE